MGGSRRISVRISEAQWKCIQSLCQGTDHDSSYVVRQALDTLLGSEPSSEGVKAPKRRLSPPDVILSLVPEYLDWGSGDLRLEQRRLFLRFLAISFVCKKHYPRTKGMIESYESLLQLCDLFGVE
jgi:hypothetical protein